MGLDKKKMIEWLLWAPLQAMGMLFVGYACAILSLSLFSTVPGDHLAAWRFAPAWIAWVFLGKKSAAAGWWRIPGAAILLVAVAILSVSGIVAGWAWVGLCGGAAGLMVCLWPWARAKAVGEALAGEGEGSNVAKGA